MVRIKNKGNFNNTFNFFGRALSAEYLSLIEVFAREGVAALSASTPVDTGNTAASWDYEIRVGLRKTSIYWTNSSTAGGVPLVILLQYGHGTGTGGYVKGKDFINPAIEPTFNRISEAIWKEVIRV